MANMAATLGIAVTFQIGLLGSGDAAQNTWREHAASFGEKSTSFRAGERDSAEHSGSRLHYSDLAADRHTLDAPAQDAANDAAKSEQPNTVIKLAPVWKFKTDPLRLGAQPTHAWSSRSFDDADWSSLHSGKSWESQGIRYAGFAWYRQSIVIPENLRGLPLKLTLAPLYSDDDTYFNGIRIGGIKGDYKYRNILKRVYYIPSGLVRYGEQNTIAVRLWGGRLGFQTANSGLVGVPYTIEADTLQLMARAPGQSVEAARPIQLYDLSAAQHGLPFDLIFGLGAKSLPSMDNASFSYVIKDFYGRLLKAGDAPLAKSADGGSRAVVPIDSDTSRKIYFSGRFKASISIKDTKVGTALLEKTLDADHLLFAARDDLVLPALPKTYEGTPYGRLKLVDKIDAGTDLSHEPHPYLQSAFGVHPQDFMTPGADVSVTVSKILGRDAREANWGWFAYRIGRGGLIPGHTYLLRIEYPEDKPRYSPVEIQTGQNYMDIGWKNGVSPDDVYANWPLTHAWQYYDVMVTLGKETVGNGGTGDGNAKNGFWVYFMDKRKPNFTLPSYAGGAAVASIALYEIDPKENRPIVNLPPEDLPRRIMTFDWERQPTAQPQDIVSYAKLMGYSAVSPVILKWGFTNFAAPVGGYSSSGVDDAHYWTSTPSLTKGEVALGTVPAQGKSVHELYLDATRSAGLDYMPRIEYGGSNLLPIPARAVGADGKPAKPNRFGKWSADLVDPATLQDFKTYLDALVKPYARTNPQLKGILWRMRQDRMQISYSRGDVAAFASETGTTLPPELTAAASPTEFAQWASSPAIYPAYSTWWQKKRERFHDDIAGLLKSYRADMTLLYFNWDTDKFSLMEPDRTSAAFFSKLVSSGGAGPYEEDRELRQRYTAEDYIDVLKTGSFSGSLPQMKRPGGWADYALIPSLYAAADGVQLLAPVNGLPYANMPAYLNYFRTNEGLAVSDMVSYDETGSREVNPKFETSVVLPGGGPFSMSVELLAYFYGDARTLTYTSYTYGRGYADAHRRFAQAFRALPAIPGTLVDGTAKDVAARTYPTRKHGTYVGVAYKGYTPGVLAVDIPGAWTANTTVTNLVTNEKHRAELVDGKLRLRISAGPMELDSFRVQ